MNQCKALNFQIIEEEPVNAKLNFQGEIINTGAVSEEVIEAAVDKYFEKNPVVVEEIDPTIYEWAKQPNPPQVDQTFNPSSENAQSGLAIYTALLEHKGLIPFDRNYRNGSEFASKLKALTAGKLYRFRIDKGGDLWDKTFKSKNYCIGVVDKYNDANRYYFIDILSGKCGVFSTNMYGELVYEVYSDLDIDQTFNPNSENAQSGKAVNEALFDYAKIYDASGYFPLNWLFETIVDPGLSTYRPIVKLNGIISDSDSEVLLPDDTYLCFGTSSDIACWASNQKKLYNIKRIPVENYHYPYRYEVTSSHDSVATKEYVDKAIGAIEIPEVDLTNYALKSDIPDVSAYQTAEQVSTAINEALGVIENGSY